MRVWHGALAVLLGTSAWIRVEQPKVAIDLRCGTRHAASDHPTLGLRATVFNNTDEVLFWPSLRHGAFAEYLVITDEADHRIFPKGWSSGMPSVVHGGGSLFVDPHKIAVDEIDLNEFYALSPGAKYQVFVSHRYKGVWVESNHQICVAP
jgi:hypothetical protein